VKAWRHLLLGTALAAAAGGTAVWMFGSALSAPAMREIGPPPPDLDAVACAFASASGGTIRGWIAPGRTGQGAVVLAHSIRSNRLEMVDRARFLRAAGYAVLLFDAQAHGESPGDHITFGHLESRDAAAAVAFVKERFRGERVAYLGISQGGAAALLGGTPLPVQALILEAVYPTLREAVIDRIEIRLGPLARGLAPLLLLQSDLRLGVTSAAIAPIAGIREVHAPLLLIAGAKDRHTRIEESRRLFEAAPEPKTLWVIPGAAHQDFYAFARAEYEHRVLTFLASTLGSL
jgi:alpha-beta hydrolase superfamily lysophospholipase